MCGGRAWPSPPSAGGSSHGCLHPPTPSGQRPQVPHGPPRFSSVSLSRIFHPSSQGLGADQYGLVTGAERAVFVPGLASMFRGRSRSPDQGGSQKCHLLEVSSGGFTRPLLPAGRSSAHSLPEAGVRSTQEARGSGAEGCWRQLLGRTEDAPDLVSSAHTWEVQSEPVHRSGFSSTGERSAGQG